METNFKPTTKILSILILLLLSSIQFSAQNSSTSSRNSSLIPLSSFLNSHKEKYDHISEKLESKKNVSIAEKLMLYENEINILKEDFKTKRKTEYLSKTAKRAKRLSCIGTHTRNVTHCQPEYIHAPNKNMYTKKDWIEVESIKDLEVVTDSSTIKLSMSANGKRTNKAVIYATFKYKEKNITEIIDKEAADLFNQVINE